MSNATVSYIGAANGVDSTLDEQRALYLKLFSGEVIMSFEKTTVCLDKHRIRTISAGKSAQFPVLGRGPDAAYHTPGAEILGQEFKQNERTLTVDKLLVNSVFLADIDEAMSHFETRSAYSQRMGAKLAQTFDNHVMREIALAAAASATITGEDGGLVVTDADLISATPATKFSGWEDALFGAAENFDNKFVDGQRYCILKPADYYFLVRYVASNGFSAIHSDYKGAGSYADGKIIAIAGIPLISSPMLPTADYSAEDFHAVNMANTKALIFTGDAVGTVKLLDLSLQSQWDIRRQGTLMVARYAMGHGILQPECAVQVKSA
jgi:hypothetical protein